MVPRRMIVFRILAGLALVALLAAAGVMIFQAGQASGVAMSQNPAVPGQTAPGAPGAPYPYYFYRGPWHFFPFAPFGLFFLCAVPFLFFFLIGGLFRPWGWGRYHMHGYGPHPWQGEKPSGEGGQPSQPPAQGQSGQPQ